MIIIINMQSSIIENATKLALEFLQFINGAITPFHAVQLLSAQLNQGGFK